MAGGSSERRIQVKIEADTSDFQRNLREAANATKALAKEAQQVGQASARAGGKAGKDLIDSASVKRATSDVSALTKETQKFTQAKKGASAGKFIDAKLTGIEDVRNNVKMLAEQAKYLQGITIPAASLIDRPVSRLQKARVELNRLTDSALENRIAWGDMGMVVAGAAATMGVATFSASRAASGFDQIMSSVKVNTGASGRALDLLREKAMEMGATTVFSSAEAADGMDQLAKAGVSTADIYGGALKGALDLAAAGEMAVGEAAETAATAMTQFGLKGTDIPHIADLLAAGAANAQGDVKDLAFAMKQGGLVAAQMGLNVDQTVSTLSAFASAGMIGSDAGTSLRTMMVHLMSPTKRSADLMKELGINIYDSSGQFVGMAGLADQLQKGLGNLSEEQRNAAMATIFGMDALRGANILYEQGAAGMTEWENKVNDTGFAAKAAAEKLNNLNGDLRLFKSAWQNAQIGAGRGMNEMFRPVVQGATEAVRAFGGLPSGVQKTIGVLGAAGTVTAALGAGFVMAVPKIASFKQALTDLGLASKLTNSRLAVTAKTIGSKQIGGTTVGSVGKFALTRSLGAAAIIGTASAVGSNFVKTGFSDTESAQAVGKLVMARPGEDQAVYKTITAFTKGKYALKDYQEGLRNLQRNDFWASMNRGVEKTVNNMAALIGVDSRSDLTKFGDNLTGVGKALANLSQTNLPDAQKAFKNLANAYAGGNKDRMKDLLNQTGAFKDALLEQATSMGLATDDATLLNLALGKVGPQAKTATTAITGVGTSALSASEQFKTLVDSTLQIGQAFTNVQLSKLNYSDAVSGAQDVLKQFRTGQASNNDVLRSLYGIAGQGQAQIKAMAEKALQGDSFADTSEVKEIQEAWSQQRRDMEAAYDNAIAMGVKIDFSREDFIKELGLDRPFEVNVKANAEAALKEIDGVRVEAGDKPGIIKINGENKNAYHSIDEVLDFVERDANGDLKIGANTYDAQMSYYELLGMVESEPGVFTITDDGTGEKVKAKAEQITTMFDNKTGKVRFVIENETGDGYTIIDNDISKRSNEMHYISWRARTADLENDLAKFDPKQVMDRLGLKFDVPTDLDTVGAQTSLTGFIDAVAEEHPVLALDGKATDAETALYAYLGLVKNSDGTVSIKGDPTKAKFELDQLVVTVDKTTGRVSIGARDYVTGTVNTIISNLPKTHTIQIITQVADKTATNWINGARDTENPRKRGSYGRATRAHGGAIYGPGTGTSDDVPAWLSNGEHVLTAREVSQVGGQDAVYRMRAAIRAGMLRFADGGSVGKSYGVSNVKVNAAAPVANVTVIVDNPLTGEQIRSVARSEADGRIVYAARMNR